MREWFFRKALRILEKHTPGIVVRAELQILLNTTARGFGVPGCRWHPFGNDRSGA